MDLRPVQSFVEAKLGEEDSKKKEDKRKKAKEGKEETETLEN